MLFSRSINRYGQWVDWRSSLKSLFSLVVRFSGSSDVPLPPFRFWTPDWETILNVFQKDAVLAFRWVKNCGCCHIFFLSCILGPLAKCDSCVFGLWILKYAYWVLKMLDLSLCEIFENVFQVIIFIQLEIQVYVILLLLLCSFLQECDTVAFSVLES